MAFRSPGFTGVLGPVGAGGPEDTGGPEDAPGGGVPGRGGGAPARGGGALERAGGGVAGAEFASGIATSPDAGGRGFDGLFDAEEASFFELPFFPRASAGGDGEPSTAGRGLDFLFTLLVVIFRGATFLVSTTAGAASLIGDRWRSGEWRSHECRCVAKIAISRPGRARQVWLVRGVVRGAWASDGGACSNWKSARTYPCVTASRTGRA